MVNVERVELAGIALVAAYLWLAAYGRLMLADFWWWVITGLVGVAALVLLVLSLDWWLAGAHGVVSLLVAFAVTRGGRP